MNLKEKKAGSHLLSRFRSIIGAEVLDFRVRNGNGYCHLAMATGINYNACARRIRAMKPGSFGLSVQSLSGMLSRYAHHKVKR